MEKVDQELSPNKKLQWIVGIAILLILVGWILNTPEGLLGKSDAIGYAVCHRIDLRSFHLGDRPLPLCARCTGMYLGALIGLGFHISSGRRKTGTPPVVVMMVLVILVAWFFIDGGNSFLALIIHHGILYEPNNTLRLFSGTGMGLVISAALFPAFNQTVWRKYDDEASLESIRSVLLMIAIAVVFDLLVLTENPVILYPLALISAAGVIIILTMLYTMVSVMLLKRENKIIYWHQLNLYILVGFGVAMLQIIFLDSIRFLLSGTWEGFHFG